MLHVSMAGASLSAALCSTVFSVEIQCVLADLDGDC